MTWCRQVGPARARHDKTGVRLARSNADEFADTRGPLPPVRSAVSGRQLGGQAAFRRPFPAGRETKRVSRTVENECWDTRCAKQVADVDFEIHALERGRRARARTSAHQRRELLRCGSLMALQPFGTPVQVCPSGARARQPRAQPPPERAPTESRVT